MDSILESIQLERDFQCLLPATVKLPKLETFEWSTRDGLHVYAMREKGRHQYVVLIKRMTM